MILHPAVIALLISSALISLMTIYASYYGIRILKGWNIKSGSEKQLALERRTYLISTLLAYAFFFEVISLFLFIFTAENLHGLFVGAMCAAGTLNVNFFGYPALITKAVVFVLAGLWLILNHVDNSAPDYPLIRVKYGFLLFITPFVIAEAILIFGYFLNLKADVITSCCGTLFSGGGETASLRDIAFLSDISAKNLFFPTIMLTILTGIYFYLKGKGGYIYSIMSALSLIVSIAAIISLISPYYYEIPTHRCPFCILQKEYGYVGYPIYLSIFGGGVFGMGVGILMPFRRINTLINIIPTVQRRITLAATVLFIVFLAMVSYKMITTDFILRP